MTTSSITLTWRGVAVPLTCTDEGAGPVHLVLHGGAGPQSMRGLAQALAGAGRVIAPVHPGFDGTPRPDSLSRVHDLASLYAELLTALGLQRVIIIGNSVGGWIAAELALLAPERVAGIALLNACGIDTGTDQSIPDPMAMTPAERAVAVFHDPGRALFAPTPEATAALAANQSMLRVYAGEPFMHDPGLRQRLAGLAVPAVVLWGESDRIVDLAYGRRFAASMPAASFHAIAQAGHFPQIERPDAVVHHLAALRRDVAR